MSKLKFIATAAAMLQLSTVGASAYNSEEHKLMTDIAVAGVNIPPSVRLPGSVTFNRVSPEQYVEVFKAAKRLSAGIESNNPAEYDKNKKEVQDNFYYRNFNQLKYNKNIWIPSTNEAPAKVLDVSTITGTGITTPMSLGTLVALYGDYRKAVSFSADGLCYLSDGPAKQTVFKRGNAGAEYAPKPLPAGVYQLYIASGVVPPHGTAGNALIDTANPNEYEEAAWWGDEMMRIAKVNDWHFSNAAVAWYVGMHRLALMYANRARTEPQFWSVALNCEASALHALTDLFAFGHVVINRDESSYQIQKGSGNTSLPPYRWMENALAMGGGKRDEKGVINLSIALPPVTDVGLGQSDFLAPKTVLSYANMANNERIYHDRFNKSGAQVRNLNGDRFYIYGDSLFNKTNSFTRRIMFRAVQESVQSLFDASVEMKTKSLQSVACQGSPSFKALKNIPVFIESDPDKFFTGKWTRYAHFIDVVTNTLQVPRTWTSSMIPFLNGSSKLPEPQTTPAGKFDAGHSLAVELTVPDVVDVNGTLSGKATIELEKSSNLQDLDVMITANEPGYLTPPQFRQKLLKKANGKHVVDFSFPVPQIRRSSKMLVQCKVRAIGGSGLTNATSKKIVNRTFSSNSQRNHFR
ncbi:MAG: hypothetical protein H6677_16290 [Candidatus Obscuribacterales bacterium]|nr:hypothetical protein [Cyanobacteria bacterium HKST-UBA01]MCB9469830.1 hypothetical protein [Candidatus Obscuribacterales bacterium]